MLLSSGVIWRYRSFEDFRDECPGGDPALQRVIVEQLDEALEWLEAHGAEVTERETGNPRTIGMRFDTRQMTETLAENANDVHLGHALVPGTETDLGGRWCSRLVEFPFETRPQERGCCCARIAGATATGST